MTTASSLPTRRALTFIFVTVALDIIAFGIAVPVLPKLIESFVLGDTARAAQWYGLFGTVWAMMQFVFSPLLGALSDRFGRRPVILVALFGLGVDYIVMALAPSLGWLLVGRIISGICGASYTTAGAYIADVTTDENRAAGFGLIGAAWGLGFVLGPALGGVLGGINPRLPFWAAAVVVLLNWTYGVFMLPESLPRERRHRFDLARANPLGALRLLRSHHELFGLAGVNVLYYLSHQVLPSVFVLYAGFRFGWGIRTVGLTLAVVGVSSSVVQGMLVRPAVRRLGERRALLLGLTAAFVSTAIYALAPSGRWFLLGVPIGALAGFYSPAAQGLMTRRVQRHEQGQLQGANSSLMGIVGMIGPGLFTSLLAWAVAHRETLPGAPFALAAAIQLAALALAFRVASAASGSTAAPTT